MNEDARNIAPRGRYQTAEAVAIALLVVGLLTATFIFQKQRGHGSFSLLVRLQFRSPAP
jgi:hypothetical protein